MQKKPSDFNKANNELQALKGITHVNGRFFNRANKFWWAYLIAEHFKLDPREVKTWDAEDAQEALAAIKMLNKNSNPPK